MTRGPDKQFDRDEVLEKAMELFWAQGYEATGMTQLTRHMGIGRQSLYDTFGGKRALYLESLHRYCRERAGALTSQLRAPGSPLGNLKKVLNAWFRASAHMAGCGCLMGNAVAELASRDPDTGREIDRYVQMLEDAFTETFERAREAGELGTAVPARDLARSLITTFQGVALLSKLRPDPGYVRRIVEAQLAMMEGR